MTTVTVLLVILAAVAAFVIGIYNKLVRNKNLERKAGAVSIRS